MRYLIAALLFLIIGGLLLAGIYLPKNSSSDNEAVFIIKRGEGSRDIALNLEKQGLIWWSSLFRLYVHTKGVAGELKAGSYSLSLAMNIPEIAEKFVKGETLKEKFTIIEGWNLKDIAVFLGQKGIVKENDFQKIVNEPVNFATQYDFWEGKPETLGLEGYLFPDTYEINKGENAEDIIARMLVNFNKKLTLDLREEIAGQKKTIFEIVTMASMIEKEVKKPEDKKLVSGILWKRLKIGMPLQVDATISYITGKKTSEISITETKIDSPYNTYKYRGLPLGPISNPGLESILASVYPEESPYLYYLSTPEGKTIFSKTLQEHNAAKAKHIK